jgi:teichuronic acid biosynthesis glycosyltransferase TuaC
MNVVFVSHLYPAPHYERNLFVHDQARALRDLGVDVRVISPTPYAPRILWSSPRQRRRGQTPRRAVRDGVAAEYPRVLQLPRRILFDRSGDLVYAGLRHAASLREAGTDLIHAHHALPDGAAAQRLAADLSVPYVVTVHGADAHRTLREGGRAAARVRSVLGGAAAVMTVGSSVARLLDGVVTPERLHVVLNGTSGSQAVVEPAEMLPGVPLVLTVGNLVESKRHASLLEAVAHLRAAGIDVALVIVGEGALRGRLEQQAAHLGLAGRVHFLGHLAHVEVLRLMARADVFALPSWPEGFGLVYTEAMTQGTPVVACRGEGPEDFIRHRENGYLVAPRDVGAIAEVIAGVLADPVAARAVGEAGRRTAGELTWQRNAERQLAIYEQVLAATGREDGR